MSEDAKQTYPRFFFHADNSFWVGLIVTIAGTAIAATVYLLYSRLSNDASPDSVLGYTYAFVGTALVVAAAVGFSRRRRGKRGIGQLHRTLNWHMCFGILGLVILFLHSFGNFNPRSGTYALYGMIALVISGLIGKSFDHFMPRMITEEVQKALTAEGEDRIESISQSLQSIVVHNTLEEVHGFEAKVGEGLSMAGIKEESIPSRPVTRTSSQQPAKEKVQTLETSWDLAYISLEETPQEVSRNSPQYRFVPDRKSPLARPGALIPGAQQHVSALQTAQQALGREEFLRAAIRYWRIFHISLAFVTVGLTLWHLEYASQLLMNAFFHH